VNAVIADSDIVTAYGWGLDALWSGLMSGKSAIHGSKRFAMRGFVSDQMADVPDLQTGAGESRAMAMLRPLLAKLVGKLDPSTPLILATTVGEIEFVEEAVLNTDPALVQQASPLTLLRRVKELLGLHGEAMVVSSACASSAAALTRAASMVRHGQADRVLVVTCDSISEFVYSGFSALLSLCDIPARPFDSQRSGLTLGEAAAWALVTSDRSAQPVGETTAILGWGNTSDAVHMTAPHRDATGLSRAVSRARTTASCAQDAIAFIAAHGTATVYSDAMELVAFRRALGMPRPIFSVKGAVGHTLAAAGLVQILAAGRALALGVIPPTVGLETPDACAAGWAHAEPVPVAGAQRALSTNSGFGGVNTAIILGRGVS
jgi:3-oxoacyl-[acyl-carrier-protein] synthase II